MYEAYKHKIEFVLAYFAITLMMVTFSVLDGVVMPQKAGAALSGDISFGGPVIAFVPLPVGLCPPHTVISNKAKGGLPKIGLYTKPITRIYRYGNLITTGANTLGLYDPVPAPCATGYPVFPIDAVGTSLY